MTTQSELIAALIATEALKVSPPGEVFWYTSGTVGPYYINTHYLFGGPGPAEELLSFIDATKGADDFPARLQDRCGAAYDQVPEYRLTVDALVATSADLLSGDIVSGDVQAGEGGGVDVVSGGERRDWFFSAAVADRLGLPHLLLYKDGAARRWDGHRATPVQDLGDVRALHVADLVTEASSYTRAWIPGLRERGGDMAAAVNVVDRAQGGMEAIAAAGVPARALVRVDEGLFEALLAQGTIDAAQRDGLLAYLRDPHAAMRRFLLENPAFLERSLASADARTAERARLLAEGDLYQLG